MNAVAALRRSPERGARMSANAREVPTHYSAAAKWLHWCVAVAVITLLLTGPAMKRIVPEGDLRDSLYNFHEALGALTLILMVARLARRALSGVPAPSQLSKLESGASLGAQCALYVLLLVSPLLGWAGTNAYGDPVSVFGLFTFPSIAAKDVPLSDRILAWHLICGILIAAVVALHVAGALYHRIVKHDGVLARMWPGG
jgi:cytochrome b561